VTWRHLTLAHYAAVMSTVAIILSGGSLIYTKRSYELSVAKDQRELKDKQPAIDVQIRPAGISNLSVTISITNRADIDISPLDIVAENSVEVGSLYFANDRQSIDKLSSSLSLTSMGQIVPKGRSTTKATLSGVTDGRFEQFRPGVELEFTVRIRFADQQDTVEQISIVRRILPPLADRLQPTPEMFLTAVIEAEKARRNQQVFFFAQILLGLMAFFSLIFYLFRLWQTRAGKLPKI
jgi:hypothetical protein